MVCLSLTDKAKKCVKQISNLKASDIIGLSLCPTLWLAVKAVKKTAIHLKQIITMKLLHKIAEEQSRAIRKYFVRYIDQINNTVHLYDIQGQHSIEVHGTGISDEIERETVIVC